MKAMVVRQWCEPTGLEWADLPDPAPGPGQVLVEMRATGCNFADILMVQGKYQIRPPLPFSPGYELAGVVHAVGPGVARVRPGQRALVLLGWGGYAEQVVAPERDVYPIPDAMSFEDAAAFSVNYQTSWCALVHRAALQPGEWLLVHAAAGGVGRAAVQIGRALGARVIATAGSPDKCEVAREAGAEVALSYRDGDWVDRVKALTDGRGADVIYDPVGGDVFDSSARCIAFEGRLLTIGFAGGHIPSVAVNRVLIKNYSLVGVHWGLYQQKGSPLIPGWMEALFALYDTGQVRPVIWKTFPLPEAAQALRAISSRESYGKVVLLPST